QGYYQQPENAFAEKGISTAHTLGIISIVAGVLFALAGLICGIIGYSKVNGLNAPAELQARCKSARTLCIVGICISAANMLFGIIIGVVTGCESTYYY
ncbi:MAG: hypothetical protein Q4D99_02025, partial [Bacillota bacterium]|nr:hypothetical protein [Bacillota bacterium]